LWRFSRASDVPHDENLAFPQESGRATEEVQRVAFRSEMSIALLGGQPRPRGKGAVPGRPIGKRCGKRGSAPEVTKVSDAGSTFRRTRRARRLGQAAADAVVGRRALGPFGHFPAHLPELVSQLAKPGSNLFLCGTVGHDGVAYRYVSERGPGLLKIQACLMP